MPSLHSPRLPWFASSFAINGASIGTGRCYIIAEAGSNHDRDLEKALALVDVAVAAGCDAVKFQTFVGPEIATGPLQKLYETCSLPVELHRPIVDRARERGITFLSSAFSEWAVDFLCELGVPAIKIASYELVHLPLIRHAASTGRPLILSTGMAGLGDIERALDAAAQGNCRQLALMHCGSSYPLLPTDANLAAIETVRRAFCVPVGYSDHTLGIAVPTAATALGADLIEKHFTNWLWGSSGPDQDFSLKPEELSDMVAHVRAVQAAIGSSRKQPAPDEDASPRRSLHAARDLRTGDRLGPDAVKIVRPGAGLEPMLLDVLLGRTLTRDVAADQPLSWDHFLSPES